MEILMNKEVEHARVRVLPSGQITRKDAATVLGREAKTLANWKLKGWGPAPVSVGGREYYSYTECLAMARGEKPIKPQEAA